MSKDEKSSTSCKHLRGTISAVEEMESRMLIMAFSKAFGMEVDMTKEQALEIIANQKLVYVNMRTRGLRDGQIDTEEKLKIFDDLIKAYDIAIEELQKGVTNDK